MRNGRRSFIKRVTALKNRVRVVLPTGGVKQNVSHVSYLYCLSIVNRSQRSGRDPQQGRKKIPQLSASLKRVDVQG